MFNTLQSTVESGCYLDDVQAALACSPCMRTEDLQHQTLAASVKRGTTLDSEFTVHKGYTL